MCTPLFSVLYATLYSSEMIMQGMLVYVLGTKAMERERESELHKQLRVAYSTSCVIIQLHLRFKSIWLVTPIL